MGKEELRNRKSWQPESGYKAGTAERYFQDAFINALKNNRTGFEIHSKPDEFKNIYVDVPLDKSVIDAIYNPPEPITQHGISPDFAIYNNKTKKTLYIEVKRQDGWVEGKKRSAGRGNAHERSCKYFTPGLLKVLRKKGRLGSTILPFWMVFMGDITRDPCRVREITCWYSQYPAHFFMWRDTKDPLPLIDHFNKKLKHLLL